MPRKRAAQGGGSIRKRPDGTWEARFVVGRDTGTGKQIRKSVYGKTQAEVRKKLQQATTAVDEGVFTEPSRLTLGGWLDIWLKEYTGNLKPHSLKSYETIVRCHIKPALGAVKLGTLAPPAIQAFINALQRGSEGKPALAPKTIKGIHGVLHKALQQAVELDYVRVNPSGACKLPRAARPDIKPLDEGGVDAFVDAIKGHPFETLYLVDLFTGMRQGEILGLTWDCLDFQKGTIFLYRQLQKQKGAYAFESLKNDKTRLIVPAPTVMKALQEHRRVQLEWRMQAGGAWESNADFVFTNEIGHHLAHITVWRNLKKVVQSIGMPETRFHDLRHSYAVAALRAGDDIKTVQENLGHHTAAFTLDVYGHVTDAMRQESAARMERFIKGNTKL